MNYANAVLQQRVTQLPDLIEAGDDEAILVAQSADDSVDQNFGPTDRQTVNQLANLCATFG
jgi:hypothetical protein